MKTILGLFVFVMAVMSVTAQNGTERSDYDPMIAKVYTNTHKAVSNNLKYEKPSQKHSPTLAWNLKASICHRMWISEYL